jgi:hypothetical protein
MDDARRLAFVRALHTAIYGVMASASVAVLYGGVTGRAGPWLWIAACLVLIESAVFIACGMKCPLTAVVRRYDPTGGLVSDTFFPKALTRHTLRVFGPMIAVGFVLLLIRAVI